MKTTEAARALTAKAEGDYLIAYPDRPKTDPNCKWTIGRGFILCPNGQPVKEGDVITPEQDEEMWQAAWAIRDAQETRVVGTISQPKFDAIGLFIYNEGIGNFLNSTLDKKVMADMNDVTIPLEFQKWIYEKINGVETIMGGLVIRRGREIALWNDEPLGAIANRWPLLKDWLIRENIKF